MIGITILGAVLVFLILYFLEKIPVVNRSFLIASVIGLTAGIILVLCETGTGNYYKSVKSWPRIDAQIIKSEVEGKRAVLPEIFYNYTVKGEKYQGKSDLATPGFGSRNKRILTARTIVAGHPEGSVITIAYNPQNPAESTTQLHPPWNYYGKTGFGLFLILCSAQIIFLRLPVKRK